MSQSPTREQPTRWQRWADRRLHQITIPVILGVTAYMAIAIRPPKVPLGPHPGVAEVLFQSRAVVLALWILAVDGSIFLLASLIGRSAAKQWARQAGPVATGDDPAKDAAAEVRDLGVDYARDARDAREEIERLRKRLEDTEARYAEAVADLGRREQELRECREAAGETPYE